MKVVVIGNGASILNKKLGPFIDEHDIVIRLGGYKIKGYEHFVGSKTDIWSNGVSTIKIWNYFDETTINKHLWIMLPEDNFTNHDYLKRWQKEKYSFRQFSQLAHNKQLEKLKLNNIIECIKNEYIETLLEELNITKYSTVKDFLRPSLGICTVFMALQKYKYVNLIGFDCLKTGWYWDTSHVHTIGKHNSLMEKIWFTKMKNCNKICMHDELI